MATDPNLTVPQGQITFDVEGNDDPNSIYFSRVAHWPGGVSGVTIGRGYDVGNRGSESTIVEEFTASGVDPTPWKPAIGLSGAEAESWMASNKSSLPEITHGQQISLFNCTYQWMLDDVIRISTKADVLEKYGATNFDTLNLAIKDIVVDLRYRGDYTSTSRNEVQPCMVENDLNKFTSLMADQNYWANVPSDRFNRRVEFLEAAGGSGSTTQSSTGNSAATSYQSGDTYVVQSGDSLSQLAQLFGCTTAALEAANESKVQTWGTVTGFNAGDTIVVP